MKTVSVKIAKAVKTFGLNGEVILRLYDTFPDEVNKKEPIFAIINGLTVPLFLSFFERRGNTKAIAIFDDIDSEYRALELIGSEFVAFETEEDDNDDELYFENIVGYSFTDTKTGTEGVITEFIDNDLNPLFGAEIKGNHIYIPASDDIIEEVDQETKKIMFSLPEGLLELYL
ncbi:MAG: 16S rRNA processing protein RimM [Rikenellaceae bacterium]